MGHPIRAPKKHPACKQETMLAERVAEATLSRWPMWKALEYNQHWRWKWLDIGLLLFETGHWKNSAHGYTSRQMSVFENSPEHPYQKMCSQHHPPRKNNSWTFNSLLFGKTFKNSYNVWFEINSNDSLAIEIMIFAINLSTSILNWGTIFWDVASIVKWEDEGFGLKAPLWRCRA